MAFDINKDSQNKTPIPQPRRVGTKAYNHNDNTTQKVQNSQ